ncbi:hypothetical protein ACEPAI_4513 [Sanghuangporus weigelae]
MSFADNDLVIRGCRTPDRRRTVAAWALYYDTFKKIPDIGWLPPDTPIPPPYEIRTFKTKGRGMVATRDIKLGEIILNELPILMIPLAMPRFNPLNPWRDMEETPLRMLCLLEQEDREKVVRLHNCKSLDSYGPLGGIFMTNSVGFTVRDSRVCTHCSPNAEYEYDTQTFIFSVRATRSIAKGEEVSLCYISVEDLSTAERQNLLREKYSFKCACKLCSNASVSDERRKFIKATLPSIQSMFDKWTGLGLDRGARMSEAKRISKVVEALLRAMNEEDLYKNRFEAIMYCVSMHAFLGDPKAYKQWVKRGLDAEVINGRHTCRKSRSRLEELLNDPTSHPAWDLLAVKLAERVKTITIYV